jgi:hypothetical protein
MSYWTTFALKKLFNRVSNYSPLTFINLLIISTNFNFFTLLLFSYFLPVSHAAHSRSRCVPRDQSLK